jgi:hypothetical protein
MDLNFNHNKLEFCKGELITTDEDLPDFEVKFWLKLPLKDLPEESIALFNADFAEYFACIIITKRVSVRNLIGQMKERNLLEWNKFAEDVFCINLFRADHLKNMSSTWKVIFNGKGLGNKSFRNKWESAVRQLATEI